MRRSAGCSLRLRVIVLDVLNEMYLTVTYFRNLTLTDLSKPVEIYSFAESTQHSYVTHST